MRLIDISPLIKAQDICEDMKCRDCELEVRDCESMMDLLMKMPTIDAVQVVRCKDCKWWDEKEDSPYGYCMAMKHGYFSSNWEIGIYRTYKGDWFCADGERKES